MREIMINENLLNKTDELVITFLNEIDVKPKTKATYKRSLRQFINYLESNMITNPTRKNILDYKKAMIENNYSNSTINAYLTSVKSFYEWLEIEGIAKNIAKGIKSAKTSNNFKKDPLTIEQIEKVLTSIDKSTIKGKRDYAIINLALRTGLRTIEILRANIEDIKQDTGATLLFIQGKGEDEKNKYVVLTDASLIPILDYLNARENKKECDPLFASVSNRNNEQRITVESLSRLIKNRFKEVGLNSNRITAHSLRHTAITLSLLGGASLQEAQQLARHKNINTTLIYSHNIERIENAPELKIDKLLSF